MFSFSMVTLSFPASIHFHSDGDGSSSQRLAIQHSLTVIFGTPCRLIDSHIQLVTSCRKITAGIVLFSDNLQHCGNGVRKYWVYPYIPPSQHPESQIQTGDNSSNSPRAFALVQFNRNLCPAWPSRIGALNRKDG